MTSAPIRRPGTSSCCTTGSPIATDGVDDGSPPVLDRSALTSAILDEVDSRGLTARSLGTTLETSAATWRPWFDAG